MKTDDFDFDLDENLIAQHPEEKRENSRLMLVNRHTGEVSHKHFYDIVDYLHEGDVLVLNDTKVLPARLYGSRKDRKEKIEVLLLKNLENNLWECLVKPGKKMKIGTKVIFSEELSCLVKDITEDGLRIIELQYEGILEEILDRLGNMPLPPYIKEELKDNNQYQTVYAKHSGSAAAPTAGLHFSLELLEKIKEKKIEIAFVTLHVGLGTFRPVKVDDIENHHMHSEFYRINKKDAEIIQKAKEDKRRVISVGTTSTRTLESVYKRFGEIRACSGWTDIFIYPGFEYKVVSCLITNFHLPKSTLMMLVSAFASRDIIMNAYKIAIEEKYRFFSFGDCMFLYE